MQERGLMRQCVRDASILSKILPTLMSGLAWLFPLGLAASAAAQVPADPIRLVNVFIGSGSGPIGYGGTMPFVTPPFGMTDWTAQTRQNKVSVTSYKYEDLSISGFMGTHQPAIWMGDFGYVTLMPEVDSLKITPDERKLPYTHADETARPDYYSVSLQADAARRIRTEITATTHCGYLRFTFPTGNSSIVMIEASRPGIEGFAKVLVSTSLEEQTRGGLHGPWRLRPAYLAKACRAGEVCHSGCIALLTD
jgi:putative alpha-1,2-mannosidase